MALLATLLLGYWGLPAAGWLIMIAVLAHASARGASFIEPARAAVFLFGALACLGLIGFFAHPLRDAAKDVWYFSKPAVELSFGLLLAKTLGTRRVLWLMIVAAGIVSADYIVKVFLALPEYLSNDTDANRAIFGPGSFLSLIACVVVIDPELRRRLQVDLPKQRRLLVAVIALSSIALVLSRSRTLAVLLVLFFAIRAARHLARRKALLFACALVALIVAVAVLTVDATGISSIDKPDRVAAAASEVAISEYVSDEDIALHWRGFEAFMALQQFQSFDLGRKVFGGGFGQQVPLDMLRSLGDQDFEALPILHNGFMYVLVKTGVAGLGLFGLALVMLWRAVTPKRTGTDVPSVGTVGIWLVSSLALATLVISGPFNKAELLPLMILCGAQASMMAEAARQRRKSPLLSGGSALPGPRDAMADA